MRRRQKNRAKRGCFIWTLPRIHAVYCRRNKLKEKTVTKSKKKKQKQKNCHRHWMRNILSFTRSIVESTVTAETAVVDATLLTAADNLERYCKASERCEMSSRFVLKVVFASFL